MENNWVISVYCYQWCKTAITVSVWDGLTQCVFGIGLTVAGSGFESPNSSPQVPKQQYAVGAHCSTIAGGKVK